VLDFRPAPPRIGMDQEPDASGEGPGDGNLSGVKQSHNVPTEFFGRPGRECGVEISSDGEQGAHDVVGLEIVGIDQGTQQLVGGRQDLAGLIPVDGGGSADSMEASWRRHGR